MIDYLLSQKPCLSDATDCRGLNALQVAALSGNGEAFLKLLAQNPRSIDVVTGKKENTLHLAARCEVPSRQVLDMVLSLRPEFTCGVDSGGDTALHCLCQNWNNAKLELYLDKFWQLNPAALTTTNHFSLTPLACDFLRSPLGNRIFHTQDRGMRSFDALTCILRTILRSNSRFNPPVCLQKNSASRRCQVPCSFL